MANRENYNILIEGELQHFDRVGSSGYKSDTGLNYRVMCLCREHHDEADNCISRMDFMKKYHLAGIYLSPEQGNPFIIRFKTTSERIERNI